MKINRNDIILIISLLLILIIICVIVMLFKKDGSIAKVYYDNILVLTIPLDTKEINSYTVMWFNGEVVIFAGQGKIKVDEENSPLHLCSKQGFVSSTTDTIVCLPNKIVIKIENDEVLDGVVK